MPYNSSTSAYERRAATVIDATPDGDTVAVAIDVKLDQGIDDYVTDLNHHNVNGNHFPETSVWNDSRFLKQSPAGAVSWADGVVAADAALKDFSNVASGAISNDKLAIIQNDKLAPISPSKIAQDASNRFTTDAEKAQWFIPVYDARRGYNYIINGNFDIWQRGTSQTTNGYGSDDRWRNQHAGTTKTHTRQELPNNHPANAKYYALTNVTSGAGSSDFCLKAQRIEGVKTLAGKKATLAFYANGPENGAIGIEFVQNFGTGGTPSSTVTNIDVKKVQITTVLTRYVVTVDIPSISDKTIGTDGNDFLEVRFWFNAGSDYSIQHSNIGLQSGVFALAGVSLVEGDVDVKPIPRSYAEELALCQRYYATGGAYTRSYAATANIVFSTPVYFPVQMRTSPMTTITDGGGRANTTDVYLYVSSANKDSARHEIRATGVGDCRAIGDIWTADAEL